jgi:hypothetical protein
VVDLDRKHSKVSKTVKNNVCEYNRTDLAGRKPEKNPSRKWDLFFILNAFTVSIDSNCTSYAFH